MNFTGTAYQIDWKQKIHNVLVKNELGPNSPYALSSAKKGKSGYSFGYVQWDLSSNDNALNILQDILTNAKDANGKYIIDDGDPATTRSNDAVINTLFIKECG